MYLKHFGLAEQLTIEKKQEEFLNIATERKIPKRVEIIKRLKKQGFWSDKNDEEIVFLRAKINQLKDSKKHIFLPSQLKEQDRIIDEVQKDLLKKERELNDLIGDSAESYAERRINDIYIVLTVFKDPQFTKLFLTQKELDEMDDDEGLAEIIKFYNENTVHLSESNLKKLAIKDIFTSYFYLTEDVSSFFGRPIYQLTFYQARLASYGKYFRHLFENSDTSKLPKDVMEDPDKLIDFVNASKKGEEQMKKVEQREPEGNRESLFSATTFVGAKKEDIEFLKKDEPLGAPPIDPFEEAKKKGGLSMEDMIKLLNTPKK